MSLGEDAVFLIADGLRQRVEGRASGCGPWSGAQWAATEPPEDAVPSRSQDRDGSCPHLYRYGEYYAVTAGEEGGVVPGGRGRLMTGILLQAGGMLWKWA